MRGAIYLPHRSRSYITLEQSDTAKRLLGARLIIVVCHAPSAFAASCRLPSRTPGRQTLIWRGEREMTWRFNEMPADWPLFVELPSAY